jgi:hypothetical protein
MTGFLRARLACLALAFPVMAGLSMRGRAQQALLARPVLNDGVITFVAGDGLRRKIVAGGKKCSDLWVSPSESVIAFITIDGAEEPDSFNPGGDPFITSSSIYLARRSDGFAPTRIDLGPLRSFGRDWRVARHPRVAPNEISIFFGVPVSTTSDELFVHDLVTGENRDLGGAVEFCVEWGGPRGGSVLLARRQLSERGLTRRCLVSSRPGDEVVIADECEFFDELAAAWSRNNAGTCS